jgi:hypothetical protein
LRGVGRRILDEEVAILGACEVPDHSIPFGAEVGRALVGLSFGEVRDRIVALDRHAAEVASVVFDRSRRPGRSKAEQERGQGMSAIELHWGSPLSDG